MIFVSLSVYALAKELGPDDAVAEVHRQIAAANEPGPHAPDEFLPAVKVIARLQTMGEVALRIDAGATVIAKARSRAFHAVLFEVPEADVWISVDDDIDATKQTLEWMLQAVWGPKPRICLAPYLLRNPKTRVETLSVQLPQVYLPRELAGGGRLRAATGGGFGLVAMNRGAIKATAAAAPRELLWDDDDGKRKIAIFHDEISNCRWYGEDLSFFRRLPKDVDVEALCTGITSHMGVPLNLESVAELGATPF